MNILKLDEYFKKGFKSYNDIKISIFQNNIFKVFYNNLKIFYLLNRKSFERKRLEIKFSQGFFYPPMKLIDMHFWGYGNMLKELEKIKKRLQNEL